MDTANNRKNDIREERIMQMKYRDKHIAEWGMQKTRKKTG
jgi:hypothetical protein